MGGLRFKLDPNDDFLDNNHRMATPPWTRLRELEHASLQLEKEDAASNPEYIRWLELLIAPGSSIGGARPKASVVDEAGKLWIAKFPSRSDSKNVGAWEMVAYHIAGNAGVNMSECMIENFSSKHHTFLTKRFDRNQSQRIHFASAMTMLGYSDGTDYKEGVSYLDLAEFIIRHGANIEKDLEELWRRIVLNILISNSDDHLRNHGFILTQNGWTLSPCYDVNPIEASTGLSLNISENDNSLELELVRSVAPFFRVKSQKAEQIISQVTKAASNWSTLATMYGISQNELEIMRMAFRT